MKKLSPAQVKTLLEIVRMHKANFRRFSCVSEYKPAQKLIELGLAKVENTSSYGRLTLVPTPEGEALASSHDAEKVPTTSKA